MMRSKRSSLRRRYGRSSPSPMVLSGPLRVFSQHIVNALVREHPTAAQLAAEFKIPVYKARFIVDLEHEAFEPGGHGFEWAVRKTARVIRADWPS